MLFELQFSFQRRIAAEDHRTRTALNSNSLG